MKFTKNDLPAAWILVGFFALFIGGIGILISLSTVKELTPAQYTLLEIADGTIKLSIGAILGFAAGSRLISRNGSGV